VPSDDECAATIESHLEHTARALAGSSGDVAAGWFVRTDDLPLVWTLNQLCVTQPAETDEILAQADACQRHLTYRHVVVRHDPSGEVASPWFRDARWRVEREVLMAIDDVATTIGPGRPVDTSRVVELTEDEALELMGAWLGEERVTTASGLAQVLEYNRREGHLWRERRFGVRDDDGTPLSITKLRVAGSYGWVEDVYALPRARGKGHGLALVTHAVRSALDTGCSLVAIVADANDWPQHLYARVGFRPVGSGWTFHTDDVSPETEAD
jgi:GNAT superfamily N-acetyltransferase